MRLIMTTDELTKYIKSPVFLKKTTNPERVSASGSPLVYLRASVVSLFHSAWFNNLYLITHDRLMFNCVLVN